MKVLLLADGRAVHTRRYQTELINQGVDVKLVSIEAGETVDIQLKRISGIGGLDYALAAGKLKSIVRQEKVDIVNPHFACGYGFMTALSGVWKTVPTLLHCLGSDILISPRKSMLHRWRVAHALKKSNLIMVDSDYLGLAAKSIYKKTDYKVIYWGADRSAFENYEIKCQNDLIWTEPLDIIVPRAHYKVYNNKFIIEALKTHIRNKRITISFPNWGDDIDRFKELVSRENIETGIKYYEFMNREIFNKFLSRFDIYLSASLSDSSPASLIEAMAAGLYPVVGDIPGVWEWMDGTNGALYKLSDSVSLTKAIDNIIERPSDLAEILKRNYDRAKENGRFDKNIKDTITVMSEMIKDAGVKE